MQIQSDLKFHLTSVRMDTIKKQKTTNAGNDVGKRKPYPLLPGIKTNRTTPEIRMEASTQNKPTETPTTQLYLF